MMEKKVKKQYVQVDATFSAQGILTPRVVYWDDGRQYIIDKVTDSRKAASLKAGGQGIRYTVRIQGKERYLWYEEPRWFVEAIIAGS